LGMESRYVHKSHNVSVLMYHVVCAAKYRRVVMSERVDAVLREVCLEIAKRWEIVFLEIGVDRDHAHFLIQSVPTYSPTRIVTTVKSVTAREVFAAVPEVKKKLWGGEFWGKGYFINTVGQHGSESVIAAYVQGQGGKSEYRQLHKGQMDLGLF
jgi:putative transposase